MELTIKIVETKLIISYFDSKEFVFDLDGTVDLNEFIKTISESEKKIACKPESFEAFREICGNISADMLKLVEYVFKIINAFNESYADIYAD